MEADAYRDMFENNHQERVVQVQCIVLFDPTRPNSDKVLTQMYFRYVPQSAQPQ